MALSRWVHPPIDGIVHVAPRAVTDARRGWCHSSPTDAQSKQRSVSVSPDAPWSGHAKSTDSGHGRLVRRPFPVCTGAHLDQEASLTTGQKWVLALTSAAAQYRPMTSGDASL
jgi:hypothetical protein